MSILVPFAFTLLCLLWGTTWGAIRIGVSAVPPFVFAFDRAAAVAVLLLLVSVVFRLEFPRRRQTLLAIAFAGTINIGLAWAIIFWAEQYVPSGLTSVFGATAPLWTALLAHVFVPDDRMTRAKAAGLVMGIVGTALLVRSELVATEDAVFVAAVVLALLPVGWAVAAIVSRLELQHVAPIPTTAIQAAAGAVVLAPFALSQAGRPARWDAEATVSLAYLVLFGTCVGFALFVWLLQRLRPTTVLLMQVIIPAEAVLIGALFLGEAITPRALLGAALVAAAVLLNALARPGGSGRAAAIDATTTRA
ncbi:MAG TPA: EamA family transporter [Candidatus Dormibacteraeota bacterium]|nr:EamA family transporter [Candidatus Dormibacteraeota bacterium]